MAKGQRERYKDMTAILSEFLPNEERIAVKSVAISIQHFQC